MAAKWPVEFVLFAGTPSGERIAAARAAHQHGLPAMLERAGAVEVELAPTVGVVTRHLETGLREALRPSARYVGGVLWTYVETRRADLPSVRVRARPVLRGMVR